MRMEHISEILTGPTPRFMYYIRIYHPLLQPWNFPLGLTGRFGLSWKIPFPKKKSGGRRQWPLARWHAIQRVSRRFSKFGCLRLSLSRDRFSDPIRGFYAVLNRAQEWLRWCSAKMAHVVDRPLVACKVSLAEAVQASRLTPVIAGEDSLFWNSLHFLDWKCDRKTSSKLHRNFIAEKIRNL